MVDSGSRGSAGSRILLRGGTASEPSTGSALSSARSAFASASSSSWSMSSCLSFSVGLVR